MVLQKSHLIALGFAVVLLVAYLATRQENRDAKIEQVELVRKAAEKDCVRTSTRSALVVSFKERSAQAAFDRQEYGLAREFRALARGGLLLVPLPADRADEREFLSEVVRSEDENGVRAYRLTNRAVELIAGGCKEAYSK